MTETIPLVTVAAELGRDVAELAATVAAHVVIDPASGIRVLPAAVCRQLVAERAAAQAAAAEAEHARRAQHEARMAEIRAGLPPLRGGVPAVSGNSFADMAAVDR